MISGEPFACHCGGEAGACVVAEASGVGGPEFVNGSLDCGAAIAGGAIGFCRRGAFDAIHIGIQIMSAATAPPAIS
jgi:hypothetical protein